MNPRLLILIVIAAGMAVYFAAVKGGAKPAEVPIIAMDGESGEKRTLDKFDLPGSEPAETPELSVQVELDRSKGKNRLYFTLSEAHGFYVEQFQVHFWYVKPGVPEPEKPLVSATNFFDRYLPAKGTLRVCLEVVPAELRDVDGDMGESSNWKAEVEWHGRARVQNPDPMPPRTDLVAGTSSCD